MGAQYTALDWFVFISYALLMIGSGWYFNRKQVNSTNDYFLAGNTLPVWMVAISVLATSQSAATFLGGPDQGYRSDLSYLATNIGAMIAALVVSIWLIPKFYRYRVSTVYELLEVRFGTAAKKQAGLMYLFGRVFASGARLYMAAIAVAMILFGDIAAVSVVSSVLVLAVAGLLYSVMGGIRSVIYSDVIQCTVYILAAVSVIGFLLSVIPADISALIHGLTNPLDGADSKLAIFHFDWDVSSAGVFNFWSAITGFVLLNIAAFGLDQDMTQRVLTCKNAKDGAKAIIWSVVLVIPVMLLFIVIGLLLYVFYQRPDLMHSGEASAISQTFQGENITIFMYYVLNEMPAGLRGLVTVGVVAAALSTLNSGLNSMSSVIIQDIYRPYFAKKRNDIAEGHFVRAGRWGMVIVAVALSAMAVLCFYWQQYSDTPLLAFALSVMVFSYSGLLGVYFTALFSKRGNQYSTLLALVTGFIVTLAMQPYVMQLYLPLNLQFDLGFTWQLCIGTLLSFFVCYAGASSSNTAVQWHLAKEKNYG